MMDYQRTTSPLHQYQQPQLQPYYSPTPPQPPSPNPFRPPWSPPPPAEPASMATPEINAGLSQPRSMSGKYTNICLAFIVIALPMILFPGILLWLVLGHRISQGGAISDNLKLPLSTV